MKEEPELTFGETIKQQFPELEDIEWVMVEAPEWYAHESNAISCSLIPLHKYPSKSEFSGLLFDKAKLIHENSQDFKVVWKLK